MTDLTVLLEENGVSNCNTYDLDLTQEETLSELADRWKELPEEISMDMIQYCIDSWNEDIPE